jgi:hypothetical protein
MRKRTSVFGVLACWILFSGAVLAAGKSPSDKLEPRAVGEEAKLLMKRVTFEMMNTPLGEAMDLLTTLCGISVQVSEKSGDKPVSLKMGNTTMAEGLTQIQKQCGCTYRVVDGKILIASKEEFAEIDADQAEFKPWKRASVGSARVIKVKTDDPEDYGKLKRKAQDLRREEGKDASDAEPRPGQKNQIRVYNINGRTYSEEELKKEKPEIWKRLKAQLERANP